MARALLQAFVGVKLVDGLLERIAADEPHRIIRPSVAVCPQAVYRYDAGMLQTAGDLRLDDKSLPAGRVVGMTLEDLLECHLAIELVIECHEDSPQTALRMRPQDVESLPVGRGGIPAEPATRSRSSAD